MSGEELMIAMRVPPDVEKLLNKLSGKTGRTRTLYVHEAMLLYLDNLEDYYLAMQRLEENLPGVPLQDVERRLGLEL
jgi:RHH-type transcriptional regulator, rel operon repressor / antitoxin RelB